MLQECFMKRTILGVAHALVAAVGLHTELEASPQRGDTVVASSVDSLPTYTVKAYTPTATVPQLEAQADSAVSQHVEVEMDGLAPLLFPMIGFGLVGFLGDSQTVDRDSPPLRGDTYRQMLNTFMTEMSRLFFNAALTDGGVSIGTTTTKVRSNASITYRSSGELKAKASTDDLWTLTGAALAIGYSRLYLLLLDAAGTATVLASDDVLTANVANARFPSLVADGTAIVGWVSIANASAGVFTPGATALNAAGITTTYFDGVPPRALYGSKLLAL
jgi:hypothetical protein